VWVDKIVDAIRPAPSDVFLEIGPGRGALTLALAPRVRRLVGIEIDRDLSWSLAARAPANVDLVTADVLDTSIEVILRQADLAGIRLRIAGNLPYNLSSPILFRLLTWFRESGALLDATLLLQREVVDRLVAPPGARECGVLSILVQRYAQVERVLNVPPGAFRPAPRVSSAVVHLVFQAPAIPVRDERRFEALVRQVFQQRRKTLRNALGPVGDAVGVDAGVLIDAAGLDGVRRPETLTMAELVALSDAVSARHRL
jgi:16S rRNA (adenine1518-N6/adenine1519-N6)-dimethyltransferase